MYRGRATLFAVGVLLILGMSLALAPAVVAQEDDGERESEASFGAQVSTFMQSTAADAESEVDRDMWAATVRQKDRPQAVIQDRAAHLGQELQTLQERVETLQAQREQGEISGVAYAARASQVRVQIANLQDSINAAAAQAASHGVNPGRLAELQEGAGNLKGPEIAAIARTITDAGERAQSGQGPPGEGRGTGAPDGAGEGDQPGNGPDGEPGDGAPGQGNGNGPDGESSGAPYIDGDTGPSNRSPNDDSDSDEDERSSNNDPTNDGPTNETSPDPPRNPENNALN